MSLRNTAAQWGSLSKTFHWLIVALLIIQGILGLVMGDFPRETRMALTALHKSIGITILFLAQVYGMHLPLGEQVLVLVLCILGGIGTASIQSGSLPVIAMICGIVGLKPEGIGIILGVNTFLDMCRTSLNVTGDLAMAVVVAKRSGEQDLPDENRLDEIVG